VLITGESGVGKELVASAIHHGSPRHAQPMVRVSCASIAPSLFESEFFGHAKGAFTGAVSHRPGRFELAHGGTLLLDEVGEIPLDQQSKLLRVLQEAEYERVGDSHTRGADVRIIAATAADLRERCLAGTFRLDLYYRLSVFPIHIPPLRERPEDVVPLANHYLARQCERMRVPPLALSAAQAHALEAYAWPGNVRELQNVIERAVILAQATRSLQLDVPTPACATASASPEPPHDATLKDVARLERSVILAALEATGWRIYGPGGAADALGLRPTTLASRLKRMGLHRPR
jgi:transcriptional regulator with GAF, ATPase, and Fis domain